MLFQPSNITPSSFAGVGGGTVAVADNVKITWQVNGNTPMTAYKIDIFDMGNNSVYSSDILTDNTPFYPTDRKGNPQYFSYEPNISWKSCGLADGNEYTLQITQWWGTDTTEDSATKVVQFSQSSFITRTKPALTITTASGSSDFSTIGSVFQDFIAIYAQEQNDSIDWVRWEFYQGDTLLDDTGIVNTQVLSYTANNMQNGASYKIVCTIQTINGVQVSNESEFTVSYELPQIEGFFEFNCFDKASNLLHWSEIQSAVGDNIQGVSNDNNYYFENGNLVLPQGSTVTWNTKNDETLNIPADWSLTWKGIIEYKKAEIKQTILNSNISVNCSAIYGNIIFLGCSDGIYWCDYTQGNIFNKLGLSITNVFKLLFSNDGSIVYIKNRSQILQTRAYIVSYTNNIPIFTYSSALTPTFSTNINDFDFSPDGKYLVFTLGYSYENCYSALYKSANGEVITKDSTLSYMRGLDEQYSYEIFYKVKFSDNDIVIAAIGDSNSTRATRSVAYNIQSTGAVIDYPIQHNSSEISNVQNIFVNTKVGQVILRTDSTIYYFKGILLGALSANDIISVEENDYFGAYFSDIENYIIFYGKQNLYLYSEESDILTFVGTYNFSNSEISTILPFESNNYLLVGGSFGIIKEEKTIPLQAVKLQANNFEIKVGGELSLNYAGNNILDISYDKDFYETLVDKNLSSTLTSVSINNTTAKAIIDGIEHTASTSTYSQTAITSIVLSGEQTCEYLYIASGAASYPDNFIPSWESTTQFMTHFELETLQAGQLEVAENSMDIYRENISTGELEKLYSCKEDITQIRDFSWITGNRYNYYGYARLDNAYTSANSFNESVVCRNQPYYLLLATTQDKEQPNVYHVVHYWRFGNNIEAGSVSNNNAPSFLNNFTGYRLKQPTARKGKSGTLTALLSNVTNGEYNDSVRQMENLYALSQCNNPLFLKDMKGNLYMVTVSGAITQTINTKSAYQEVKVSIPWEEIGSAEEVSIIQLPTDEGWVDDNAQLAQVRLEVDEATGMLKVIYPDDYNYATTFGLVRPDLYATTDDGVEEAELELVDGAVILNDEE